MGKPKFLKVYCISDEITYFINVNYILSMKSKSKDNFATWQTNIEFKGNQGYRNHSIYVLETADEILSIINNL